MNGSERIAAERLRQISEEGWDIKHDEQHASGELTLFAALYLLNDYRATENLIGPMEMIEGELLAYWGDLDWLKYKDKLRNLEIAGALIAAEIDRILANNRVEPDR